MERAIVRSRRELAAEHSDCPPGHRSRVNVHGESQSCSSKQSPTDSHPKTDFVPLNKHRATVAELFSRLILMPGAHQVAFVDNGSNDKHVRSVKKWPPKLPLETVNRILLLRYNTYRSNRRNTSTGLDNQALQSRHHSEHESGSTAVVGIVKFIRRSMGDCMPGGQMPSPPGQPSSTSLQKLERTQFAL